jgi:hypothetical protein
MNLGQYKRQNSPIVKRRRELCQKKKPGWKPGFEKSVELKPGLFRYVDFQVRDFYLSVVIEGRL